MTIKELFIAKANDLSGDVYLTVLAIMGFVAYYKWNKEQWVVTTIAGLVGLLMGFLQGKLRTGGKLNDSTSETDIQQDK